jgi:putative ABC transport system substrate-binding protein
LVRGSPKGVCYGKIEGKPMKLQRRHFLLSLFIVSLVVLVSCSRQQPTDKKIHILLYGRNPLLVSVAEGIKDGVTSRARALGKSTNYQFIVRDAGAQTTEAAALAASAFSGQSHAVVALGTPMIHAAIAQRRNHTPLFFGATSDPKSLKLTEEGNPAVWRNSPAFQAPAGTFGLISDLPYPEMADLIINIITLKAPNKKGGQVGYPINDAEPNSVLAANQLEELLKPRGYTLTRSRVTDQSETSAAVRSLISKDVDLIQIGPDSKVTGGLGGILSVTEGRNIPVLASERESVTKGVAMAVGIDFRKLGERLGEQIVDRTEGKSAGPAIILFAEKKIFLNQEALGKSIGVSARDQLIQALKRKPIPVEIVK